MNILIVDDEKEIADVIEIYLKNDGHNVSKFYYGMQALECIETNSFDLAILDVMLPDVDGFTVLQKIREKYNFPVLMLTAKNEYMDKINGLTLGADDYIAKPFNPLELIARVKAHLRRSTLYNDGVREAAEMQEIGGLVLDRQSHECTFNGDDITLTPIEFDIIWMLCENRGKVISSKNLFEHIWGETYQKSCNNTVMVHIRHLREKLGVCAGRTDLIKTVWGVGYKVEE